MKLSHEEETFLRHWIYDETRYQERVGAAKQLQVERGVRPADFADLIAAALPDPSEQEAASLGPPTAADLAWPWTANSLRDRLAEARAMLAKRHVLRP